MPTRAAAPRPNRNPVEKWKAPSGKSKAMAGSKWNAPVTITASVVTSVPTHSVTVSVPMESMRR